MTRAELHAEVARLTERVAALEGQMPQIRTEQAGITKAMEAITEGLKELLDEMRKR